MAVWSLLTLLEQLWFLLPMHWLVLQLLSSEPVDCADLEYSRVLAGVTLMLDEVDLKIGPAEIEEQAEDGNPCLGYLESVLNLQRIVRMICASTSYTAEHGTSSFTRGHGLKNTIKWLR